MAAPVMARFFSHAPLLRQGGLAGVLLLLALTSQAQALRDPTRPPDVSAMPAAEGKVTEPAGPQLQSVLLSPQRKVAVINGQSVRLGEKYGDTRLVRLTDSAATLRRGRQEQVLHLFSGVGKTYGQPASAATQ